MHCKLHKLSISHLDAGRIVHYDKTLILDDFKDSHVEPQEFMLQRALHFAAQFIREGATEVRITSDQ